MIAPSRAWRDGIEDSQARCPKCDHWYCPDMTRVGVCVADMHFSDDATSRGDEVASYVRYWYERNRETWWDRHKPGVVGAAPDRSGAHSDDFVLRLVAEVGRVQSEAQRQYAGRKLREIRAR